MTVARRNVRVRRRRRPFIVALLVIALTAVVIGVYRTDVTTGTPVVERAYSPQWSRNGEVNTPAPGASFTNDQVQKIIQNNSYESFLNFSHDYDIWKHFDDARRMTAAADEAGHPIHILEYFNVAFWLNGQTAGWRPYTDNFQSSWLLHDSRGATVPFYGINRSGGAGNGSIGAVLDLRNPGLRAWMVSTIVSWMKAAPYAGIHLDSANLLLGGTVRRAVGNGHQTWNELFCGADSQPDVAGNCEGVSEWNHGLVDVVQAVRDALAPAGLEVDFNGIAPSDQRGPTRNLSMLNHADDVNDEDFCYHASPHTAKITFSPMLSDITILQQAAAQNKRVFEITNFQNDAFLKYGSYCLAGFLMGWEPNHGFWAYHRNYSDPLKGPYPYLPEQNLNLGNPTGSYSRSGSLLSRSFQHGVVAVNLGSTPVSYHPVQRCRRVLQRRAARVVPRWPEGDRGQPERQVFPYPQLPRQYRGVAGVVVATSRRVSVPSWAASVSSERASQAFGTALRRHVRPLLHDAVIEYRRHRRNGEGHVPDFLVIGVQKCGTTGLFDALTSRPEFGSPLAKEIRYFNRDRLKDFGWYCRHFWGPIGEAKIWGEATPAYFDTPAVPDRVATYLPDVKLLLTLRDPLARAVSHYHHARHYGMEREPLAEAFAREVEVVRSSRRRSLEDLWTRGYLARSCYSVGLRRWHNAFPSDRLQVLVAERRVETLNRALEFVRSGKAAESEPTDVRLSNVREYPAPDRSALTAAAHLLRADAEVLRAELGWPDLPAEWTLLREFSESNR